MGHGLTMADAWSNSAPTSDTQIGRAEIMDTLDAVKTRYFSLLVANTKEKHDRQHRETKRAL